MIRLLSVDDHKMIHRAIAHMASQTNDMVVVGEAHSGEDALDYIEALRPNIVMMDLNMPGLGGIVATQKMTEKYPNIDVIVVSAHTHEPYPSRAMAAGASGFLCKDCEESEMLRAIRRVHAGGRYVSAEVAGDLSVRLVDGAPSSPFDDLSERELAVALQITNGLSTQAISDLLTISPNTVSTYRRRIFDKLDIKNDVELTLVAFRHGLVGDLLDS
ncbi:MAG: response regulator [Oceanococcus sp.]